jgi:arylsulfatase A-like enzyme
MEEFSPAVNDFSIQVVSTVPLIVRIPAKWKHLYPEGKRPGTTVDRIVSFIDMPKTWLSLTGAKVTNNFQGRIFLGSDT